MDRLARWWGDQSLRARLVSAAALAVAIAIGGVAGIGYVAVRHELLGSIDDQLRQQAHDLRQQADFYSGRGLPLRLQTRFGEADGYVQVVFADGDLRRPEGQQLVLPVSSLDRQVAVGGHDATLRSAMAGGLPLRVLTVPLVPGVAVQVALPTAHVHDQLQRLATEFAALAAAALALAVGLAWVLARRAMRPVEELTATTEQIAATRDLTTRIAETRGDELGRLAASFNAMLDALESSVTAQRRLVADASHELRTPLASLRTNVEVLQRVDELPPGEREAVIAGIVGQLQEITDLVADVVELARGDEPAQEMHELSLDRLVLHAVDRARRHWPAVRFTTDLQSVTVRGVGARLDRAVANLLDNAAKYSDDGGLVEVTVTAGGLVRVRDHGSGVPEDALPHVFDRFYRADESRARPGSGLGLAIVRQVADAHGAGVTLGNAPDGGAVAELDLTTAVEPVSFGYADNPADVISR